MHGRLSSFPLARLIKLRGRLNYRLPVRMEDGEIMQLVCEFQTQNDFVFSAALFQFEVGQQVALRVKTLRGRRWYQCTVSMVESHAESALYQMTIGAEVKTSL